MHFSNICFKIPIKKLFYQKFAVFKKKIGGSHKDCRQKWKVKQKTCCRHIIDIDIQLTLINSLLYIYYIYWLTVTGPRKFFPYRKVLNAVKEVSNSKKILFSDKERIQFDWPSSIMTLHAGHCKIHYYITKEKD